jgi:hypothetical protein
VLTAWAVFSITPDFARIFVPFNKLDIQVDNDGRLLGAAASHGEWIDTNCTAWPDRFAVLGGRSGIQYLLPKIEHVTLCIYTEQNGSSVSKQFNAKPKKLNDADRISLVLDQLLGLFFIACGAILVWQAPNAASWGFSSTRFGTIRAELRLVCPFAAVAVDRVYAGTMQGTAERPAYADSSRFRTAFSQKLSTVTAAEYRTRSDTLCCCSQV